MVEAWLPSVTVSSFNDYLATNRGATARIAEALGVTHAAVRQWKENGVPPERVLDVERITGISRHVLRPDVFGRYPTVPPVQQQQGAAAARRGQMS